MLLTLIACSAPVVAPSTASIEPPADWYWADDGLAIDWPSVTFDGGDPVFRTDGDSLRAGPVEGAEALVCGQATRATLLFEDGELVDTHTFPDAPCVEALAWSRGWSDLSLEGTPVGAVVHAVVVYEVPMEAACSSNC